MSFDLPQHGGETARQRDDIDRLVGIARHHGEAFEPGLPRLLIAVDGSEISHRAVRTAVAWRSGFGWRFETHIVNVQPFLAREAAEAVLEKLGREDLAEAERLLAAGGMAYTTHILMGPPAVRLLAHVRAIEAAQVLMGTSGRGRLETALLGSVAQAVVRDAGVPVTLVR